MVSTTCLQTSCVLETGGWTGPQAGSMPLDHPYVSLHTSCGTHVDCHLQPQLPLPQSLLLLPQLSHGVPAPRLPFVGWCCVVGPHSSSPVSSGRAPCQGGWSGPGGRHVHPHHLGPAKRTLLQLRQAALGHLWPTSPQTESALHPTTRGPT